VKKNIGIFYLKKCDSKFSLKRYVYLSKHIMPFKKRNVKEIKKAVSAIPVGLKM
jgi:hypothetical protein